MAYQFKSHNKKLLDELKTKKQDTRHTRREKPQAGGKDSSSDAKKRTLPKVDLEEAKRDPEVLKEDKGKLSYRDIKGYLFYRGVSPNDVAQGGIGDCFFAGALSAVAKSSPQLIKDMIQPVSERVFLVRFYKKDFFGKFKEEWVAVDIDLPVTAAGRLRYMEGVQKGKKGPELWPSIVEKAYAKWKGSYGVIGEGGWPDEAMEELTGKPSLRYNVTKTPDDRLWERLKEATKNRQPITAVTYSDENKYKGTGIHANHTYTIFRAFTKRADKKRYVLMRNPWGPWPGTEPQGDGKEDGIFTISFDDFKKYFEEIAINKLIPPRRKRRRKNRS